MTANRVYSDASSAMRDLPYAMQATGGDDALEYEAQDQRLAVAAHGEQGAATTGACKVSQRGAGANFSVDIAAGQYVVKGDSTTGEGSYVVTLTGTVNLTMPSAPAATRTHRVIIGVENKETAGGSVYAAYVDYQEDTGSGTPALAATAEPLALVTMTSGMPSITDAAITDARVPLDTRARGVVGGKYYDDTYQPASGGSPTTLVTTSGTATSEIVNTGSIALKAGRVYELRATVTCSVSAVSEFKFQYRKTNTAGALLKDQVIPVHSTGWVLDYDVNRQLYVPAADESLAFSFCAARGTGSGDLTAYKNGTSFTVADVGPASALTVL